MASRSGPTNTAFASSLFTDKVEHSGIVEHVDLSHLSESQLTKIERILESADSDLNDVRNERCRRWILCAFG